MKLSTAINKAKFVYVSVALGGGVMGSVKISKPVARKLVAEWANKEDFEGDGRFSDDYDYGLAVYYEDDKSLYIGN